MANRWFQIHLSTVCVLVLLVAGLTWLNVRKTREYVKYQGVGSVPYNFHCRGWPWRYSYFTDRNSLDTTFPSEILVPPPLESRPHINFQPLFLNIFLALAILAATAFGWEWWARRRDRVVNVRKHKVWFQLHLSTILLLSFAAGSLLFAEALIYLPALGVIYLLNEWRIQWEEFRKEDARLNRVRLLKARAGPDKRRKI